MSSTTSPNLPFDIIETVIDTLAVTDTDKGFLSVRQCALTCHEFLPLARKHLFASIAIGPSFSSGPPRNLAAFAQLIQNTPQIVDHIRTLRYWIRVEDFADGAALRKITKMRSLWLSVSNPLFGARILWDNNPLRPALLHLLHLPSLTQLDLISITDFITSDLIPCKGLKDLNIFETTFADKTLTDDGLSPSVILDKPLRISKFTASNVKVITGLCRSLRPDGKPHIDFGCLAEFFIELYNPDDVIIVHELLKQCVRLTGVRVSVRNLAMTTKTWFANMVQPSLPTLKDVQVHLWTTWASAESPEHAYRDPLSDSGLSSELEQLSNKNIIEKFTLVISHVFKAGNEWGMLDELLTGAGWARLSKVALDFQVSIFNVDDTEKKLLQALKEMPGTHLPRLSSSQTIDFAFSVRDPYA